MLRLLPLFFLVLPALAQLGAAFPTAGGTRGTLEKRGDETGLQSSSRITQEQVDGVLGLLNRTAVKSWEVGTHLQALLEFSYTSLTPFSSSGSSSWAALSPSTSPAPSPVLSAVASVLADKPASQAQLISDGSAADPASVGVATTMAYYLTSAEGEVGQGIGREEVGQAIQQQVEALLSSTPRTDDGAISHRVEDVELWSDFVYMVPPFFAYLGVFTHNTTLIEASYDQIRLYRQYLRSPSSDLWTHIYVPGGGRDEDGGLWATGNGWAAAGMLRVLATLANNKEYQEPYSSQSSDIAGWVGEIVEAAWAQPMSGGLFHNYLNDTSSFADSASTCLLCASTYRLAYLSAHISSLSSFAPSSASLAAAESAYLTVTGAQHLSSSGVLAPVANPSSFSDQLRNVKTDGSGHVSPEGQAFVLLMEAARRDFIENGGTVSADAREARAATSAATARIVSKGVLGVLAFGMALLA
ncbi:hypothetical protein JCM10213_006856 [Rhodosporidiobolus nylandii]